MADPDFRKKVMRTCPKCRTPARPHYKYCEVCGTRIPDLLTCSRCGTQFITPITYCDLCGARVIPKEKPEPYIDEDEGPLPSEADEGEYDESMPEETPGYEEDAGEPDAGEPAGYPDDDGGDESYEEEVQEPAGNGIQEPDTEDLIQTFGNEYDDSETVESSRTSRTTQKEQPAAAKSPSPGRRVSDTVTRALFFPDDSKGAPEKKPKPAAGRMRLIVVAIVFLLIIAAAYFIVMPMLEENSGPGVHSSATVADITSLPPSTLVPVITPATQATPARASGRFEPQPTQTLPSGQSSYIFRVEKSPFTSKILVTYAGSAGHGSISSADVTVTRPDGSVATGTLLPLKGITEIVLDGSKETDRVEIIAGMTSGESYRVYDQLVG